uniref:Uncharacterized protein n=1 Tax=viral metagenome TaxID=1070528 RepID=A0A6H1ZZU6_9ZZZZ
MSALSHFPGLTIAEMGLCGCGLGLDVSKGWGKCRRCGTQYDRWQEPGVAPMRVQLPMRLEVRPAPEVRYTGEEVGGVAVRRLPAAPEGSRRQYIHRRKVSVRGKMK